MMCTSNRWFVYLLTRLPTGVNVSKHTLDLALALQFTMYVLTRALTMAQSSQKSRVQTWKMSALPRNRHISCSGT